MKSLFKISPAFEDVLPPEYRELVANGPSDTGRGHAGLGTFKELIEEHPLCAGCGLALALRLTMAALPAPGDTVIVGSTGCSSLLFPQVAVHNIHSLFGNQNAVAAGLKRALELRFPDRAKDVVVIAGDGATADIGLDMVLHSWFRREKITTIMLDNEAYANTGGQESGMSVEGTVLYMAPKGKKFPKIALPEIARDAGCAYVAVVAPDRPRQLERAVRRAILVAREVGPTYIQLLTPCPTNYKLRPNEAVERAKQRRQDGSYTHYEHLTAEAQRLIEESERQSSDG
jgi:pyruvate ferredoxin oxidoreductase beta subunit